MRPLVALLAFFAAAVAWAQPEAKPLRSAPVPAAGAKAPAAPLTTIPRGRGLPVVVRVGAYFVDVAAIDENKNNYTATVDLRLRWVDPRLRYDGAKTPRGFYEFRAAEADARLTGIWSPEVGVNNIIDKPTAQSRSLRLYPDGTVEIMQRITARFGTTFDVETFPFDRQNLDVLIGSKRENSDLVVLDFRQDDLDFSAVAQGVKLDGWTPGLVDIRRQPQPGWYGESYSQVKAALEITRKPGGPAAAIFIPLIASLLIPMLAIWLNRVDDGEFQIETFELSNIIIGGLFAVIALNFTVNAAYEALGASDNTVSRLFALNYVTLGVSLLINILLFRFGVVKGLCGKYVQEQLYKFLMWGVPACVLVTVVAVLAVAMV